MAQALDGDAIQLIPLLSIPKTACSSTFVIKSRLLGNVPFSQLEKAATIDFGQCCTIFVLSTPSGEDKPALHELRQVLKAEATCLDLRNERVWRVSVDAVSALSKVAQLGFFPTGCCVSGSNDVHTWTLVHNAGDQASETFPLKNGGLVDTFEQQTSHGIETEAGEVAVNASKQRRQNLKQKLEAVRQKKDLETIERPYQQSDANIEVVAGDVLDEPVEGGDFMHEHPRSLPITPAQSKMTNISRSKVGNKSKRLGKKLVGIKWQAKKRIIRKNVSAAAGITAIVRKKMSLRKTDGSKANVEVVCFPSAFNNPLMVLDNYVYRRKSNRNLANNGKTANDDTIIPWLCVMERCGARVRQTGIDQLSLSDAPHTCSQTPDSVTGRLNAAKKKLLASSESAMSMPAPVCGNGGFERSVAVSSPIGRANNRNFYSGDRTQWNSVAKKLQLAGQLARVASGNSNDGTVPVHFQTDDRPKRSASKRPVSMVLIPVDAPASVAKHSNNKTSAVKVDEDDETYNFLM